MFRQINRLLGLASLVLMLASCAQIVPPSGGEKDTSPPQLIGAIPPNYSTRFASDEIWLMFDEYVQLKDINVQLLISPPLTIRPDVTLTKKGVLIRLKEDLLPNTTYTFNFGEGIVDLNEGNPAALRYVVSTGEVIDSLSVKGSVTDAIRSVGVEGVKVLLFSPEKDSLPLIGSPLYFSRSDKSGLFSIDNVRAGKYRLFALEEKNNNYRFDNPEERIGFASEALDVNDSDSLNSQELFLFSQESPSSFIRSVWTDGKGYFAVQTDHFSRSAKWVVQDEQGLPVNFLIQTERSDSTRIWIDPTLDPAQILLFDDESPKDTVTIKNIGKPENTFLNLLSESFRSEDGVVLEADPRAGILDASRIRLRRDSTSMSVSVEPVDSCGKWQLRAQFSDGDPYELEILPGAFGWKDVVNDSLFKTVQCSPSSIYGNLEVDINIGNFLGQLVLELIDSEGNLLEKVILGSSSLEKVKFTRLVPGKYKVKILEDKDLSESWTSGNYLEKLQPEQYYNLDKDIVIRSNWDIKVSVDLNN